MKKIYNYYIMFSSLYNRITDYLYNKHITTNTKIVELVSIYH